jgi:hypothetical protein
MLNEFDVDAITSHGTIALALLAAEYVLPLLAPQPTTRALLENVLRDDWAWVETRSPELGQLYWDYMPQLMEEDTRLRDDALLPVLHCCLYAQTYFFWTAEGITNLERPGTVLGLGNDIAEVDESYLTQCLELAVSVSPQPQQAADWLNGLISHMEREQRVTPADVIGSCLRRRDFTVPAIAN